MSGKKVLIIGGGFAGISLAKALGNTDFEVTLIDKNNHHLFQPLLYQVASAALSPGDISAPLRDIVKNYKNVKVVYDEVIDINKREQSILTKSEGIYEYDSLVVAVGAKPHYFGNDDWKKYAPGIKTLEDALQIRNKVLKSFELAEKEKSPEVVSSLLNFVVVGGGPTGVELAGAFAEIAKETLLNDFRNLRSDDAHVYLIEGGKNILPSYSEELSDEAENYLKDLGVQVIKNQRVTDIQANYIEYGDVRIPTQNVIWAAGNKAHPFINELDCEQDYMGRAIVNNDLSLKNDPNIYVLGDCAHFANALGNPLPGVAPVASQQGKHLASNLLSNKRVPFVYFDKGSMATIGKYKAILEVGRLKLSGFLAWFSWSFIHVLFLIKFRNRISVFFQWAIALLFFGRGVRIITRSKQND